MVLVVWICASPFMSGFVLVSFGLFHCLCVFVLVILLVCLALCLCGWVMSSFTFLKKILYELIVIENNCYQAIAIYIFSLCQKVADIGNLGNTTLTPEEGEASKEGSSEHQKSFRDDKDKVGIQIEDSALVQSPVLFPIASPRLEREKLHCSHLSTSNCNDSLGKTQEISEI